MILIAETVPSLVNVCIMWWVYDLTKSRSHTARKMRFSIKDLFSGKLHFLCSVHYKFALGLSSNSSVLTHFMQLVSFYTPSKHQKAKGTRGIKCVSVSFLHVSLCTSVPCPVYTGSKLNVHKTSRRRPGRPLNVLCTFNLRVYRVDFISKLQDTTKT